MAAEKTKELAVVYMRMSTDRQEYSIDSQWRLLSEWAGRNHYSIVHRYEDAGVSAMETKISKRVAFLQMVEDAAEAEWGTVLIYDSSRFSRSLKDSVVYKSMLKESGVQVISITEPVIDEDTSIIMDAINGAQNELYIRKLSKNVKRGQEQKVIRGEIFTKPPFGYRRPYPSSPFVVVPEEAEVVRYVFDQYLSGRTIYGLATEIAQTPVRTRHGNPFDTRQIERILTNPIYKGWCDVCVGSERKRYVYKANHEAIITEEQFDTVQEELVIRQKKRGERQRPAECKTHWLSGKIQCGQCGAKYHRRNNTRWHSPSFICNNYAKGKCIKPPTITQPVLENLVLGVISQFATDQSYQPVLAKPKPSFVVTDYDSQIKALQRKIERLKKAYVAEVMSLEEYKSDRKPFDDEIARLESEKNNQGGEVDMQEMRRTATTLLQLLSDPDTPMIDKQRVADVLIERVIIHPDRTISVIFNRI